MRSAIRIWAMVLALALALVVPTWAANLELKPIKIAPDVYAIIGELGGAYENDRQNGGLGFVVTKDGVVVINSGSSVRVAKALHAAIPKITNQSIIDQSRFKGLVNFDILARRNVNQIFTETEQNRFSPWRMHGCG